MAIARALFLLLVLSACSSCLHGSLQADNVNGSDAFIGCHWGAGDFQTFYDE